MRTLRVLAKTPHWTATVALTTALGIGATVAIFSIVNAVLLRPLPFPQPKQLYWISELLGRIKQEVSAAGDYYTMRQNTRAFSDMAAYDSGGVSWSGVDRPEQWNATEVTASFFPLLGVQPLRGRIIRTDEDRPGGNRVAVLSYDLWQRRFGGDPGVVGQTIRLDRNPTLVIGIMPRRFDFPKGTDLWIPLALNETEQRARMMMRIVNIVARAKPGVDEAQVSTELLRLRAIVEHEYPPQYHGKGFIEGMRILSMPLQQKLVGRVRPAILAFAGAVGLMLLIVCFNVANLLLARATARRREIAIRVALGAPRSRIVTQLIAESAAVSGLGGLLGIALAFLAIQGLNSVRPLALAGLPEVSVDLASIVFAVLLTALTGLAFGLAPAFSSASVPVHEALQSESRTASGSFGLRRFRQGLVVAQLALSLTLLIGAGLLAKSFLQLRNTDPGFRPQNLLTARMSLTGPSYATAPRKIDFYRTVLEKVRREPGVESDAFSDSMPVGDARAGFQAVFRIENRAPAPRGQEPQTLGQMVTPDFFRTLAIPLLKGRFLDANDVVGTSPVIVVNEAFARRYFPNENAVGRRISIGTSGQPVWLTIVGISGDARQNGLDREVEPTIFRPLWQYEERYFPRVNLLIRCSFDPAPLVPSIQRIVASMDRDEPIFDVKTMDQRLTDSLGSQRFNAALIGAFALLALVLAAVGVYGVMSYLVVLRTQEIGIRMALGAQPRQVLNLILREGLAMAVLGGIAGVIGAVILSRYLSTLLFGVTRLDPFTYLAVPLFLLGVVFVACYIPGHRAARVDPLTALRHE